MKTNQTLLSKEETIKQYLKSLETSNYEAILNLFTKDSVVKSPIYGFGQASQFFKDLLNDTANSEIALKNIFISSINQNSASAQFEYIWTFKE